MRLLENLIGRFISISRGLSTLRGRQSFLYTAVACAISIGFFNFDLYNQIWFVLCCGNRCGRWCRCNKTIATIISRPCCRSMMYIFLGARSNWYSEDFIERNIARITGKWFGSKARLGGREHKQIIFECESILASSGCGKCCWNHKIEKCYKK